MDAALKETKASLPSYIGRYEIQKLEAEGGMGVVFVARDPRVKRLVAVKLLKKLFSQQPNVRRRFEHEAEAIAQLEHQAIIPIYDFGEHNDMLYIVMRYVSGGTLRDRIERHKRMNIREVSTIIGRMASALGEAHKQGIVHRDIKPANILFDEREQSYLSDFGVAKALESDEEISNSQGSLVLGTPQYLSPEQAMGREVDCRTDVYSLGVVAFHALTGRPPFEAANPIAMAMAHVNKPPPKIRTFVPELPKVADEIFDRVLAKRRRDRYQSTVDFARDLRDIASGRWYLVKLATRLVNPRPRPCAPPPAKLETNPSSPAPLSDVAVAEDHPATAPNDLEQTTVDFQVIDSKRR